MHQSHIKCASIRINDYNLIEIQMASEYKPIELYSPSLRPIIPSLHTPTRNSPNPTQTSDNAILKSYQTQYQQLKKQNSILRNQIGMINREREELKEKLEQMRKEQQEKRKRHRRTANEISRNFVCPRGECERKYGSEGSLLQHIKLKHSQFYNSEEYEQLLLSKHKKNKEKLIGYSLNSMGPSSPKHQQ